MMPELEVRFTADRLWQLVQEVKQAVNDVGDYLTRLTEHGDLGEYRGGKLRFTGWKWGYESQSQDAGFVAQWVWFNPDRTEYSYYVNLPSGENACFEVGRRYEIGNDRVTGKEPDEQIVSMVENGKKRLLAMVDEYLAKPRLAEED